MRLVGRRSSASNDAPSVLARHADASDSRPTAPYSVPGHSWTDHAGAGRQGEEAVMLSYGATTRSARTLGTAVLAICGGAERLRSCISGVPVDRCQVAQWARLAPGPDWPTAFLVWTEALITVGPRRSVSEPYVPRPGPSLPCSCWRAAGVRSGIRTIIGSGTTQG